MDEGVRRGLTSGELMAFFDRLFPAGFGGPDVAAELAPEGWERSPLMACFHPSPERRRQEREQWERSLAQLRRIRRRPPEPAGASGQPDGTLSEPVNEPIAVERPVNAAEEVTELVGCCLWDVFSDNHEVVAADGRVVDLGSFRSASGFLDDYLNRAREGWFRGDYMRFYMGTAFISGRADLTPVYRMIFRRLRRDGADWVHHFPSREDGLDRPAPATVAAYRAEYGRDPRGGPPA